MAQAPDSTSTQPSLIYNFASAQVAGTPVNLSTAGGESIVTVIPTKTFQSVVISTPALAQGEDYVLSTGGQATGELVDSVYADGSYSGGSAVESFTLAGVVTSLGVASRFSGGPGGMRPPRP